MNKYKPGELIMFDFMMNSIINGLILDVIENKHWFNKPTYTYKIKYNLVDNNKNIVGYSYTYVDEDKIYKHDFIK